MKKWNLPQPEVNLKGFTLRKINEPQYRHLWWLLFWPIYYLRYFIVEALNPAGSACHVMYCALDDVIPLCEYFLIPYGLWMVFMLAMTFFTMLYDVDTFRRYMKFLTLSILVSTTVFIVYPTCQNLRPETFERSNLFTWILSMVYKADTSTNVCPSEHVIGSMAILAAAANCRYLKKPGRLTLIAAAAVIISLSTVFLKQHSLLDVLWALPLCLAVYLLCFGKAAQTVSEKVLGGFKKDRKARGNS